MIEFLLLLASLQPAVPLDVYPSGPGVMTSLAPTYPEAARKARMYGYGSIDVVISEDGSVESCSGVGTNPLLVGAAQRAASQWKFTKSDRSGFRCATLLFEFRLEGEPADDGSSEVAVTTPYSLVLVAHPYPPVIRTIYDPMPQPCFISFEPGNTTFCERALRLLPWR